MARSNRTPKTSRTAGAVVYCRVSTEEQAEHGVSLAAQEERLRAYCTLRGLVVAEVVIDAAVSGGLPMAEREGGARVLAAVRAGRAVAVVALKLDRLFRDAADCLTVTKEWDRAGVALHLVDVGGQAIDTSSTMGRFFLTMMAGVAEMERNLIADRTRAALAHKKAHGERTGSVPFGSRLAADGVHLEACPAELAVIRLAQELRADGLSLRQIGAALEARGLRPRNGAAWHAPQIARMMEVA
ncbi:MAG: recombinase family protein [Myxococcota bacterium]|jgi:DNA invertase Pin-like site-specific DNA recombinase|nr:recombinase family protein [Myxococcota bacterium]